MIPRIIFGSHQDLDLGSRTHLIDVTVSRRHLHQGVDKYKRVEEGPTLRSHVIEIASELK